MNKSTLTAASLLALILLVGGVVWYGERQKTSEVSVRPDRQESPQTEATETDNPEMMFDDQGRELVWYEIPELGIRFKVTPDAKEDLGYTFREYGDPIKTPDVTIYSKGETDETLKGCSLSEENGWSCGFIQIAMLSVGDADRYQKNTGMAWCADTGGYTLRQKENKMFCGYRILDSEITDQEYKKFFHISDAVLDKEFGIYLDTIELLRGK